jgi:hypothetical protein
MLKIHKEKNFGYIVNNYFKISKTLVKVYDGLFSNRFDVGIIRSNF